MNTPAEEYSDLFQVQFVDKNDKSNIIMIEMDAPQMESKEAWYCDVRFSRDGHFDDQCFKGYGVDAIQSLIMAMGRIKYELDKLQIDFTYMGKPYWFYFPKFIPFSYGAKLVDAAEKKLLLEINDDSSEALGCSVECNSDALNPVTVQNCIFSRNISDLILAKIPIYLDMMKPIRSDSIWQLAYRLRIENLEKAWFLTASNPLQVITFSLENIRTHIEGLIPRSAFERERLQALFPYFVPTRYGLKIARKTDRILCKLIEEEEKKLTKKFNRRDDL